MKVLALAVIPLCEFTPGSLTPAVEYPKADSDYHYQRQEEKFVPHK